MPYALGRARLWDSEEFEFVALYALETAADAEAHALLESLKCVRQQRGSERTCVRVNGVEIGADLFIVMAGPGAVESERH